MLSSDATGFLTTFVLLARGTYTPREMVCCAATFLFLGLRRALLADMMPVLDLG